MWPTRNHPLLFISCFFLYLCVSNALQNTRRTPETSALLRDSFNESMAQLYATKPVLYPNTINAIPADRTAFVAIHFENGAAFDDVSLTAVRTVMATVLDKGMNSDHKRDRVVITSPYTRSTSIATLRADGLKVIESSSLPLPSFLHSREDLNAFWGLGCAYFYRRNFAWALYEHYDRIVILDSDVLVERPLDSLFFCGRFCFVYSSQLHFSDGVMVAQPDANVYSALLQNYRQLNVPHGLFSSPHWDFDKCQERAWWFYISAFGDLESAPLFDWIDYAPQLTTKANKVTPSTAQFDHPAMRLPVSVSLNAMLWYEFFTWKMVRSQFFHHLSDNEVPGLTISFTTLKPYFFPGGIFFNLNWYWQQRRIQLLGDTFYGFWFLSLVCVGALFFFATRGVKSALLYLAKSDSARKWITVPGMAQSLPDFTRSNKNDNEEERSTLLAYNELELTPMNESNSDKKVVRGKLSASAIPWTWAFFRSRPMTSISFFWLPLFGADLLGWFSGIVWGLGLGYVIYFFIPSLTPPGYAWTVFAAAHLTLVFLSMQIVALSYLLSVSPLSYSATNGLAAIRLSPKAAAAHGAATSDADEFDSPVAVSLFSSPLFSLSFLRLVGWSMLWEAVGLTLLRQTFYSEFVVKIVVAFPILGLVFLSYINSWRSVYKLIEADQRKRNEIS